MRGTRVREAKAPKITSPPPSYVSRNFRTVSRNNIASYQLLLCNITNFAATSPNLYWIPVKAILDDLLPSLYALLGSVMVRLAQ